MLIIVVKGDKRRSEIGMQCGTHAKRTRDEPAKYRGVVFTANEREVESERKLVVKTGFVPIPIEIHFGFVGTHIIFLSCCSNITFAFAFTFVLCERTFNRTQSKRE